MSTLSLVLLAACAGLPAEVPDSPGEITAAVLPDLVTIGSVDLPWLLWLTTAQLSADGWRDCPEAFEQEDGGLTFLGNDCVDSTGVQWFGSASVSVDATSGRQVLTLQDFGANDNVGGWTAKGQVAVTITTNGYLMDTTVAVTSLAPATDGGSPLVLWADTTAAYTTYDDVVYADRSDGQIGVEAWGTAEVTARLVPVSLLIDCGWASPFAGRVGFTGTNEASVTFSSGGLPEGPPADTGDTGDTADTAADTDDTDDTDLPEIDDDDEPDGVCGVCRDATIDGVSLEECIDLTRTLSWPFPAPY
ncbi:MAG: hypothetical protein Q8P18_13520 [Pseudomonadota bacterium]|nr:hypothetical protein [Pseudomonadota bacterium]